MAVLMKRASIVIILPVGPFHTSTEGNLSEKAATNILLIVFFLF